MRHRINLKGPWEFTPVSQGAEPVTAGLSMPGHGTAKFPAAWQTILGDFRGTVRFTRPFNRPTNLELTDRIDLIFEGIGGTADIVLNQQPIGTVEHGSQVARFNITQVLAIHNRLEVTINWNGPASEQAGLWGPVALEICSDGDFP